MRGVIAFATFACVGCGGLSARMNAASTASCPTVVAEGPRILADPGYAQQPPSDRIRYEIELAECDVVAGKKEEALKVAKGLPDSVASRRDEIVARSEAALGNADATRAALESLVAQSRSASSFFVDTAGFEPYAGQDWFMALALEAWSNDPTSPHSLSSFAASLVHQAGGSGHLLSLSVAAADPDRPGGDWALWTGRIQQARLDRGGDQTLLKVEGVDVKQEVTERERLVSVHGRPTFAGGYEATPKYETERSSHPVYIPNGREFFVRYPHARESIVTMRTISVFGRFMGRDKGEALPAIDALVVIKREEQQ